MTNPLKKLGKFGVALLEGLFSDDILEEDMAIRFGHFDPLQLTFQIMNTLMSKGIISYEEARNIIMQSLPPDNEMSLEEKNRLIDSLLTRIPPPN